jgi:hypothetical protein
VILELRHVISQVETLGHSMWRDKPNHVLSGSGLVLMITFSILLAHPIVTKILLDREQKRNPKLAWEQ